MLWKFEKCTGNLQNVLENLQNVLEKPLVSWIFLEMVKGGLQCLEFTSKHLKTSSFQGPWRAPNPRPSGLGPSILAFSTKRPLITISGTDHKRIYIFKLHVYLLY